jgi:cobalt-zinc-cadmium efflux system membrane fusion protein
MKTGQFADPQQPMMRVVSTSGRLADLLVYEKDIDKVKAGQRVDLWPATPDGQPMRGVVLSVGQTLDAEAKAVHVRVSIGAARGLVTGMYVRGEIAAAPRRSTAILQDGLVAEDGKTYLFTATRRQKGWVFHPVEVSKGMEEGGMAEVLTAVDSQVALTGAYDLMSEMKKGETGEHD